MLPARPPFMPLLRRLDAIVARCHRLIERARDPYRPERHYMRGPGPKWNARHRADIAGGATQAGEVDLKLEVTVRRRRAWAGLGAGRHRSSWCSGDRGTRAAGPRRDGMAAADPGPGPVTANQHPERLRAPPVPAELGPSR